MAISDSELRHLAQLAALSLSDEERESLRGELNTILEYVAMLSEAPTTGVEATSHLAGILGDLRDDITQRSLPRDTVKSIASDFSHGGFRVPKVL